MINVYDAYNILMLLAPFFLSFLCFNLLISRAFANDCRSQLTQGRKVLCTLDMITKLVQRVRYGKP